MPARPNPPLLRATAAALEADPAVPLRPDVLADLSDLLVAWHASAAVPRPAAHALPGPAVAASPAPEQRPAATPALTPPPLADLLPRATDDPAQPPWRSGWSEDFLTLDVAPLAPPRAA